MADIYNISVFYGSFGLRDQVFGEILSVKDPDKKQILKAVEVVRENARKKNIDTARLDRFAVYFAEHAPEELVYETNFAGRMVEVGDYFVFADPTPILE